MAVPAKYYPWDQHYDGSFRGFLKRGLFPDLFRGEEFSANLREILGHSMKCGGLVIPDPWLSVERAYNTSKASSAVLVGTLLGGTNLNYVAHKGCICRASADGRNQQELAENAVLWRRKEMVDGMGLNRLRLETDNWAWLTAIPHCLNGTELSWEEFQDNLLLWYSIVPLNPPTHCNGYSNKFLFPHDLSFPKGGLVLARNNNFAKE